MSKLSIKYLVIFLLIFVNLSQQGFSQDIFSVDASNKYADFLIHKRDFNKAITEYERLLFLDSGQMLFYKHQLAYCHFKLGNTEAILNTFNNKPDSTASQLIFLSYIRRRSFDKAAHVLNSEEFIFETPSAQFNKGILRFYQKEFSKSEILFSNDLNNDFFNSRSQLFTELIHDTQNFKLKSPVLALGLSSIIPGLGRVYTKDYADAAVNFVFIGLTAFQAYRGFTNDNIGQWQGWFYGGLSLSFYLGDLFGSYKAAKDYNQKFYNQQFEKADYYIFSNL